jgi:lipoprotein-anchoring transpeptidase ErfK/SrfK
MRFRRRRYRHRAHQPRARALLVVGVGVAVAVGFVVIIGPWRHPDTTVASRATTTGAPATSATTTAGNPVTTLPDGNSSVATATVPVIAVFDDPSSPAPTQTLANPWFVNGDPSAAVPLVFLVEAQRADGWIQVQLPTRPNGSTGWVHASDVQLATMPFHITVSKHDHHLTAFRGHDVVFEDTVAVGAPETPTPIGVFFIRALLQAPNAHTVYGPYAYGLSGYSDTLQEFEGGDAEIGIHGNNDASVLGQDVTHGCVRMSNAGITQLVALLPLGTPVEIDP